MASASNSAGATGTKGLSKGGSPRVNGQQPGAGRGESPARSGLGSGDKGKGAVRPNGMQGAGMGGEGENQNYRQSYKRNNESFRPTKSGSVR